MLCAAHGGEEWACMPGQERMLHGAAGGASSWAQWGAARAGALGVCALCSVLCLPRVCTVLCPVPASCARVRHLHVTSTYVSLPSCICVLDLFLSSVIFVDAHVVV